LFEDLAAGRASALEALYELAAPQLYGLALWRTGSEEDAADVVQDVFVRVAEQGAKLAKVRNPKA
jgi:DNA-directed RNA polymerase specialized sigma24 family protein